MRSEISETPRARPEPPVNDSYALQVGAIRATTVAPDRAHVTFAITLTNGRRHQLEVPTDLLRRFAQALAEFPGEALAAELFGVPLLAQENR